jgi:hypothetical protein
MTPPPRHVARSKQVTANSETPQPDDKSSIQHPVSDDAAGDEGIDEPAADASPTE